MTSGWGFSDESSTSIGWGFENDSTAAVSAPYTADLEAQIVNSRNRARRIMTTVPEFTAYLAQAGLEGPRNIMPPGLERSAWAKKIGFGAQFTAYVDTRRPESDLRVIKRVNVFDMDGGGDGRRRQEDDANFRKQLYTIETEIMALCHPPLRRHRNIVKLFAWGYDCPEDSNSPSIPVLYMEMGMCSLHSFLANDDGPKGRYSSAIPKDILGYQLCLDVAEGLAAMHKYGIVHGDIKPDNILIFPQDNPKVPYIAKLSDFGVCVALQGESVPVDFTAYRGTPGWRPPEAARYVEEIHGPFAPELLLKSDSFSYGLLVLSVLGTGGHPPLAKSLEASKESSFSLLSFAGALSALSRTTWGSPSPSESTVTHSQVLVNPLEDALAALERATHLRETLRTLLRSMLPRLLQIRPENRDRVSSDLLADDEEDGYLDWRRQKDNQFQSSFKPSYTSQAWKQGTKYWLEPDIKVLRELDERYDSLVKQGENPRFPGETLHGMAIAHLSSGYGRASYLENVDKALGYIKASALEGFYVSQGICERLHQGLGRPLSDDIDKATRSRWLYNAASTGSLLASEILMQSDSNLCLSARSEFRKNGGYNDGYARTVKAQTKLLEKNQLAEIMENHDINKYVVDIQGNRLLHLASMVGNVEAALDLIALGNADVNARNDAGETPLLLACKAGHSGIAKLLVDSGADASIKSDDPFSIGPLHWLFNFEEAEIRDIGRILVQKAGASVNHCITPLKVKAIHGGGYEYPYGQIQAWHFPFEWPYGTAFHWATFSRSRAAIDVLCEMGADIDAFDSESPDFAQTALSMAANRIDVEMVEYLLKKNVSPTKVNRKNKGPLHFLSEDIGVYSRGLLGWRGLQDWILCGTSAEHRLKVDAIVKLLLEAGCDIEEATLWGRDFPLTPLAFASGRKLAPDANVTLSLVKHGAKIDIPLSTRCSLPQEWAHVNPGNLAYPDSYITVLTTLISGSSAKILGELDTLGSSFLADLMGNSKLPFQTVCQIVECYRASDCAPDTINSRDKNGYTALHRALGQYVPKIRQAPPAQLLEALRLWGADLTAASNEQKNALHILGENDWLDDLPTLHCLQLFKKKVSPQQFAKMIDQQDTNRHTPLMFMAKSAKLECIKWLLEEGVDMQVQCKTWSQQDWTALDFALQEAERYRRWFLLDAIAYENLRSGLHNYNIKAKSRTDDLKDYYPKVFQHLRSKGAKRGIELGFKTGGNYEPQGFDSFALKQYNMKLQTPEEWMFVYELDIRLPNDPPAPAKSLLGKLSLFG